MKFTQLFFAATLMMVSTISFGQSEFKSEKKAELKKSTKVVSTQNQARPVRKVKNPDGYMGKTEAILSKLIANKIPANFPKYEEGMGAEKYKVVMKNWAKNNKNLIKEEYRKKLN